MSSTFWVKLWTSVGRSAKVTRKNSSCGFEAFNKAMTASRARSIFVFMLPLTSRSMPTETGESSFQKCLIGWECLFSYSWKFSRSSPVMGRCDSSVTVTGTGTRRNVNFIYIGLRMRVGEAQHHRKSNEPDLSERLSASEHDHYLVVRRSSAACRANNMDAGLVPRRRQ